MPHRAATAAARAPRQSGALNRNFADMTPGGTGGEGALPAEHAPPTGGLRRRDRATASTALGFARAQKTRLRGERPLAPALRFFAESLIGHRI